MADPRIVNDANQNSTPILQLLLSAGELTQSSYDLMFNFCERWKCSGYDALLETHLFSESRIADLLARNLKIDRMYHIDAGVIQADALSAISYGDAIRYSCLPYLFLESGHLEVVIADPSDLVVKNMLEQRFKITWIVSERTAIQRTIDEVFSFKSQLDSIL